MKKCIMLWVLSVLLCFTVSCNKGDAGLPQNPDTTDNTDTVNTEEISTEQNLVHSDIDTVYSITLSDGTKIFIGAPAEQTLTALGTPLETLEAPSCIHEGTDCVYTFDGFTLLSSPDGKGNQIVTEFALVSDIVALENGLTIGSDKTAVETVFGTDYTEQFGVLRYTLDNVEISIILDADSAVSNLVVVMQ